MVERSVISPALAASAKPDIVSLDVLLADVDEGRYRIPKFQRPYVWTPQMMRELMDSVIAGYPIGSLLIWTPRDIAVETIDKVGPIEIPERKPSLPLSLVLDGHQRIATLYGILRLPENFAKGQQASASEQSWWVGFDLRSKETKQIRTPDEFADPLLLPFRSLLRTSDFVRFARGIDAQPHLSEKEKSEYIDQADNIQRAVRDYRIAITTVRDGGIDDAVAIFSRVNRSGRRITTDQMAVALTFREGFNLEESLDRILNALSNQGFGDVSRKVMLQTLLHSAGRNFTKPNFDDLRKSETQQALSEAEGRVTAALKESVTFLSRCIGFRSARLLPYALQLLLLATFFEAAKLQCDDLSSGTIDELKRWFWTTSFSGWFAFANSSELERSVGVMKAFAVNRDSEYAASTLQQFFGDRTLRPFPKTFDRRSARIRALLLVQMSQELKDPSTNERVDGSALMSNVSTRDLPYIFPPIGQPASRSPANRILLNRRHGSSVHAVLAGCDNEATLLAHGIDSEALAALRDKDHLRFVHLREKNLRAQEARFLGELGLSFGEGLTASEDEVDIEE